MSKVVGQHIEFEAMSVKTLKELYSRMAAKLEVPPYPNGCYKLRSKKAFYWLSSDGVLTFIESCPQPYVPEWMRLNKD